MSSRRRVSWPVRVVSGIGQWCVAAGLLYLLWTQVLQAHVSTAFLAGPQATFSRLGDDARDGALWSMIKVTLSEALTGFGAGTAIGVVLALVIVLSPPIVGQAFEPLIAGFYAMPKFVFTPVLFVWIGSGFLPRMYLVLLAVFPVITIYTITGMRTVDPGTLDAFRRYGANRWQIGLKLLLPRATGYLVTAITFALPHALTFAIGAEILFGTTNGIGGELFTQSQAFNSAGVLAALVVGTALSALFIWLSQVVGRRLTGVDLGAAV
jgi:NitT/TauT family transport system permease protein